MCLIAEMTCDFAFTIKHSLSRPIRFDVMSSLVLHVYVQRLQDQKRNGDIHGVHTTQVVSCQLFQYKSIFPCRKLSNLMFEGCLKIDYVTMTSNWHCPIS